MEPKVLTSEQFKEAAEAFAGGLVPRAAGATVLALHGDLGAGKTTFTQHVAAFFGISESVTSPTFVIQKVYALHDQPFERLVHIDAYRLDGAHDLAILGWDDLVAEPKNLILVEWADRVTDILPESSVHITLGYVDEHTRSVQIEQ